MALGTAVTGHRTELKVANAGPGLRVLTAWGLECHTRAAPGAPAADTAGSPGGQHGSTWGGDGLVHPSDPVHVVQLHAVAEGRVPAS